MLSSQMHDMVISCSSLHDVEWTQTYGGTSPPTAHSGSRGREVINCPLPSVCDKVCSRGCEILWLRDFLRQLPHFLHNLTRTIRGGKQHIATTTRGSLVSLTPVVLTRASAVTLTQSSVPQSMFHQCSDWETPLWAVSKTTQPGSSAAEGGSGKREREREWSRRFCKTWSLESGAGGGNVQRKSTPSPWHGRTAVLFLAGRQRERKYAQGRRLFLKVGS